MSKQEALLEDIRRHLEFIHYCSDAHVLYKLEQDYKIDRNDVIDVQSAGGFGYVMCNLSLKDGHTLFITDETMAGMLLC